MITDIGSLAVSANNRLNKFVVLCVILVLCGGCTSGEDRLNELLRKFSLLREDLNEAQQLLQDLAATEGISGFVAGALYNDKPDRVRYPCEAPCFLKPLDAVQMKDLQSNAKFSRLSILARRLSCDEVFVDKNGQVQVIMYYGRTVDYGYEFFGRGDPKPTKNRDYFEIPGERNWYAFREYS